MTRDGSSWFRLSLSYHSWSQLGTTPGGPAMTAPSCPKADGSGLASTKSHSHGRRVSNSSPRTVHLRHFDASVAGGAAPPSRTPGIFCSHHSFSPPKRPTTQSSSRQPTTITSTTKSRCKLVLERCFLAAIGAILDGMCRNSGRMSMWKVKRDGHANPWDGITAQYDIASTKNSSDSTSGQHIKLLDGGSIGRGDTSMKLPQ
jgi:hypothetical protein